MRTLNKSALYHPDSGDNSERVDSGFNHGLEMAFARRKHDIELYGCFVRGFLAGRERKYTLKDASRIETLVNRQAVRLKVPTGANEITDRYPQKFMEEFKAYLKLSS